MKPGRPKVNPDRASARYVGRYIDKQVANRFYEAYYRWKQGRSDRTKARFLALVIEKGLAALE